MRRFLLIAALFASLASSASAGVVSNIVGLGLPHTELWNDQSYETAVFDSGVTGQLDVGDVLTGVFSMESYGVFGGTRIQVGGSNVDEITGIFAAEVATKLDLFVATGGVLSGFVFTFKPYAAFEATYGAGAMLAAWQGTGATKDFVPSPVGASFASSINGTHLATLGFTGLSGEGWRASTNSDVFALLDPSSQYNANLNPIISAGYANQLTTTLDVSSTQASSFVAGKFTEYSLTGNIFPNPNFKPSDPVGTNFPIADSSDIYFTVTGAVPEPGSLLMWAGLAALVGFGKYRGRNKKSAV